MEGVPGATALWEGATARLDYTTKHLQYPITAAYSFTDYRSLLESVPTVLTQPRTPVSFRGMCICSLFDFRKTPELRRFRFPETPDSDIFRYFCIM